MASSIWPTSTMVNRFLLSSCIFVKSLKSSSFLGDITFASSMKIRTFFPSSLVSNRILLNISSRSSFFLSSHGLPVIWPMISLNICTNVVLGLVINAILYFSLPSESMTMRMDIVLPSPTSPTITDIQSSPSSMANCVSAMALSIEV